MPKKAKRQQNVKNSKFTFSKYKYAIMIFVGIAIVVVIAVYFGIHSLIPVNGNTPAFAPPINTFMKATHSPQTGWLFTSQSTAASRSNGMGAGFNSPTIFLKYGALDSIHLINEDADTRSLHNLNIDIFNVHTKSLGYFESQSLTFIANKIGTFVYYCNIHPEMRGLIKVEQ
jgi:plastocyanin